VVKLLMKTFTTGTEIAQRTTEMNFSEAGGSPSFEPFDQENQ